MKLLSPAHTNAKMAKNKKYNNYISAILHLAPADLSGFNTCPAASKGCKMACLNTAGRGVYNNVQQARIRKTKEFFTNQTEFMRRLIGDINTLVFKGIKLGKQVAVRLNGTSDIAWESIKFDGLNIFELFPSVQFYDYTKRPDRIIKNNYANYHLTFSRSECNEKAVKLVLERKKNVAVVFSKLPEEWNGVKVINGDEHDFRFLDETGVIVGLTAKGKAKKDVSGFVVK